MGRKGSITVFFSLILAVVVSLLGGLLLSAKISAGRVQIANGVDISLFSTMAKYDRALFEEYHLFYIDGGYGTETLQLGKALDEIEEDLEYAITPNKKKEWLGGKNFLQLEEKSGSIVGYTVATDCDGSVFWEQILSYMEDTLSLQGISLLSQNVESLQSSMEDCEKTYERVEEKGTVEDYEEIKETTEELRKNISKNEDVNREEEMKEAITPKQREEAEMADRALEGVSLLKKSSLLHRVTKDVKGVSAWKAAYEDSLTDRPLASGMGYLELVRKEETVLDDLLFQEYVMQNINSYVHTIHGTGPEYGIEKILFGENTDKDNLEKMVKQLILMREAVNVTHLYTDTGRLTEVRAIASSLAAVLGLPGTEVVLEGAIALAWAYAESLVDVCCLLDGKDVALIKNRENWQVDFSEIIFAIEKPVNYGKSVEGISYEDYLRLFLAGKSREDKVMGCMDVIESSMRELPGKESFAMDRAIDSLEVEFVIRVEDWIDFTIAEKRSYRTM